MKRHLHWFILAGLVAGFALGLGLRIQEGSGIEPALKLAGDIFLRLLIMCALPLILVSIISAMAGFSDAKRFGKIGLFIAAFYLLTTFIAGAVGMAAAVIAKPGAAIDNETREKLTAQYGATAREKAGQAKFDLPSFVRSIVPENPFEALASGKGGTLQVIFFAILFGLAASTLAAERRKIVADFSHAASEAVIKIVTWVMYLAPLAVFCISFRTTSLMGISVASSLLLYSAVVVAALAFHVVVVYGAALRLAGINIKSYVAAMQPAWLTAFGTSSSAATLPVNLECTKKAGADEDITNFALPLGATVNMDGTAIYQAVATIFIAQVYGIELGVAQLGLIVLMAVAASIGAAAIPGAGLATLILILDSVGIPREHTAIILAVDRLLDMFRTTVNVTGDSVGAVIASKLFAPARA